VQVEMMPGDINHFAGRRIRATVVARGDRLADSSGKAEEQQPSDHCNEDPEHPPSHHHAVASSAGGLGLISDWFRGDLRRLLLAMVAR
jgi:hypothetical protein